MSKDIHFGNLIKQILHKQERSIAWLASKIHCDRGNLYKILSQKDINPNLLRRISYALNYNFVEPLSQQINENLRCEEDTVLLQI